MIPPSIRRLPRCTASIPSATDFNGAMQQIEDALSALPPRGAELTAPGLILRAPGGASYRVTVGDDGVLRTAAVIR
jgi:hypothetical protein